MDAKLETQNGGKTYSIPVGVQTYQGEYPDLPEFQAPWEYCLQFGRGQGAIASNFEPMQSSGILQCSILIINNTRTNKTAGFHIDAYNSSFNDVQSDLFIDFMAPYFYELDFGGGRTKEAIDLLESLRNPSHKNIEKLKQLTQRVVSPDDFKSRFIYGTQSRDHRYSTEPSFLEPCGISVRENILVNSGDGYFEVIHKPEDGSILVNTRKSKQLFEFRL